VSSLLFRDYQIHTVGINWENIHGVRVAPNVYSTTKDLDRLILGIETLATE